MQIATLTLPQWFLHSPPLKCYCQISLYFINPKGGGFGWRIPGPGLHDYCIHPTPPPFGSRIPGKICPKIRFRLVEKVMVIFIYFLKLTLIKTRRSEDDTSSTQEHACSSTRARVLSSSCATYRLSNYHLNLTNLITNMPICRNHWGKDVKQHTAPSWQVILHFPSINLRYFIFLLIFYFPRRVKRGLYFPRR